MRWWSNWRDPVSLPCVCSVDDRVRRIRAPRPFDRYPSMPAWTPWWRGRSRRAPAQCRRPHGDNGLLTRSVAARNAIQTPGVEHTSPERVIRADCSCETRGVFRRTARSSIGTDCGPTETAGRGTVAAETGERLGPGSPAGGTTSHEVATRATVVPTSLAAPSTTTPALRTRTGAASPDACRCAGAGRRPHVKSH